MKKISKTVVMPLAAMLLATMSASASAEPSNFQNSCRKVKLTTNSNNAWISAECRRGNGSYNNTTLILQNIVNNNGKLEINRREQTSFQKSCRNPILVENSDYVAIQAICKNRRGVEQDTWIELLDIENRNGVLRINR